MYMPPMPRVPIGKFIETKTPSVVGPCLAASFFLFSIAIGLGLRYDEKI